MSTVEALIELVKSVGGTPWTVIGVVLAYQSPKILKEIFGGGNTLLLTISKISRDNAEPKPKRVTKQVARVETLPVSSEVEQAA